MTFKEIQDLLKMINKYELKEFQLKEGEFEISIKTNHDTAPAAMPQMMVAAPQSVAMAPVNPAPAAAPAAASPAEAPADDISNMLEVKSPIVGTFYRSASPEQGPYVKVGDSISEGDTVCIVEAMKLFNEIESEVTGKIVKVCVEDASPIEYDQVLFLVDPKG